ncbi:F0F1 ATP synthase subunit alpha [Verrucomicrobiota bacterium]
MALKINLIQLKEHGKVVEIRQDVINVTGLDNCMNGQLVKIGDSTKGVIVGFDSEYVLVLEVKEGASVKPGDPVITTMDEFRVPVGENFIGRRINAMAEPVDGGGPIKEATTYPIFNIAPGVLERTPLREVMETGTKIIDMTLPVGKGQRMLVLGDRMTGKTTVCLDAIINQKGKDVVCIYCCIGKSEASLNRVIETFNKNNVWDYTIIVAATAADPMGQQYLAPYVASSLGEYFMCEKGGDVLVCFDDFTKHAWAYRQISLLLERAPGRDAYPGDIFYIHSQLVERAGKLNPERGSGSMTHIPIVETLEGDFAGYIPSNTISMTDGQIYLNGVLFGEGFKPAIDMGLSVSRIGNKVQWPAMKKRAAMLKMDYIRHKELEKMTRIKAGVSGGVEERLKKGKCLEELLKQDENLPVAMEDQVILLFALENGFFKNIEPVNMKDRCERLLEQVHKKCPDVVKNLIESKQITDEIKEVLNNELARFDTVI